MCNSKFRWPKNWLCRSPKYLHILNSIPWRSQNTHLPQKNTQVSFVTLQLRGEITLSAKKHSFFQLSCLMWHERNENLRVSNQFAQQNSHQAARQKWLVHENDIHSVTDVQSNVHKENASCNTHRRTAQWLLIFAGALESVSPHTTSDPVLLETHFQWAIKCRRFALRDIQRKKYQIYSISNMHCLPLPKRKLKQKNGTHMGPVLAQPLCFWFGM